MRVYVKYAKYLAVGSIYFSGSYNKLLYGKTYIYIYKERVKSESMGLFILGLTDNS